MWAQAGGKICYKKNSLSEYPVHVQPCDPASLEALASTGAVAIVREMRKRGRHWTPDDLARDVLRAIGLGGRGK